MYDINLLLWSKLLFIEMTEIVVIKYCSMDEYFSKRKIDILIFSL